MASAVVAGRVPGLLLAGLVVFPDLGQRVLSKSPTRQTGGPSRAKCKEFILVQELSLVRVLRNSRQTFHALKTRV
ncbi:hypothetical protein BaRGS_00040370 [Batillaria attramentaria]|uniref:Uncharacterized protein n=1 Tax=Batillaria attramentaria TaxID=370345 RepID=A0ABD0J0B4_9CAEN